MYDDKAKIRDELIMTLTAELPVMRARLGMSQEVMASAIGVSRQTYSAIETRTKKMSWTMFMALIAVLDMNEATSVMLDQIPDYIQTIRQLTEKKQSNWTFSSLSSTRVLRNIKLTFQGGKIHGKH